MLKPKWTIEPGDGTGCSLQDAKVRNDRGICAYLDCGQPLSPSGTSWGLMQKLCVQHEESLDTWIKKEIALMLKEHDEAWIKKMKEING